MNQVNYELARLQGILLEACLICAATEVKEYKEDWRKTPILRQGGRFASKDSSANTKGVKESGNLESGYKKVEGVINKIQSALPGFTKEQADQIRSAIPSTPVQKAMEAAAKAIDKNISPEAGKAFREFNAKINGHFDGTPSIKAALDRSTKDVEKAIADSAKVGAAGLGAGAVLALAGVTGVVGGLLVGAGAGATALGAKIAIPQIRFGTVFGVEPFVSAIQATLEEKSWPEIAEKFAEGGLSQLTFKTGLTLAVTGIGLGVLGLVGGEVLDQITADTIDYELKRTAGILKGEL